MAHLDVEAAPKNEIPLSEKFILQPLEQRLGIRGLSVCYKNSLRSFPSFRIRNGLNSDDEHN